MIFKRALLGVWTGIVVLSLINVDDQHRGQVGAVGDFVFSQMMRRVNQRREELLILDRRKSSLDKWRAENERMLGEAFEAINSYLEVSVKQDDFDSNIDHVNRLYDSIRDGGTCLSLGKPKKKTSFFKWPSSKSSHVAEMNAVLKALVQLKNLRGASFAIDCSGYTTHKLTDINRIAMDTIGRRERGDNDLFPRIDHLIFTACLRRAESCLPKYKEQLLRASDPSEEALGVMRTYWNRILEHRMKQVNFGDGKPIAQIFSEHPKTALELVKTMRNALEEDELSIGAEIFNNLASSSWDVPKNGTDIRIFNFNKYVMKPCDDHVTAVRSIIESLDFDLQLRRFIPEPLVRSTDQDGEVNKHRAYFSMCNKAITGSDRIAQLLGSGG